MTAKVLILIVFIGVSQTVFSQGKKEDSLRAVIQTAAQDTNKINALNILAKSLASKSKNDEALKLATEALEISQKINFQPGVASAYINIATAHNNTGLVSQSLEEYNIALKIRESLGDKKGIAFCRNLIGNVYNNQGRYPDAMREFLTTLSIYEQLKDEKGVTRVHNNIGNVYFYQKNYKEAIKEYSIALKLREKMGDEKGWAGAINNIGVVYEAQEKYPEALQQYKTALGIRERIGDELGVADSRQSMANVYNSLGQSNDAMIEYAKALEIQEKIVDKSGIALSHYNMANLYYKLKQYANAKEGYESALVMAKEADELLTLSRIYQSFSTLDSAMNNHKDALIHYRNYIVCRDSLFNEANTRQLTQTEMQYEFDKKDAVAKAEQEKKDAIAEEEKRKQRLITIFITIGLGLVIIFALFVVRSLRITKKQKNIIEQQKDEVLQQKHLVESQKHIIEEKHKEITDSINYAERIQRSFLASETLLNENLASTGSATGDYFVYFQPKDIVSGDFYWASTLKNGNFAFSAADSTGHGVPGAIMSILNISSLEKSIEKETEPAAILNETRKHIIERLKKDGSTEGGKDGMDNSLIVLEKDRKTMTYAAANNPVWIVRNGSLLEFAPDKMPVGKHEKDTMLFTQHRVDLQPGDVIYSFTDGMADQFGGPKGKKFMYKQLKQLLVEIAVLPMQQQKQKLLEAMNAWKGKLEQVDDVCVIGVRI